MVHRRSYGWLALALAVAVAGCTSPDMQQRHEENVKKWDDFWGGKGSGGGLFQRHSGDTEVWTIECAIFNGTQHDQTAEALATAMKKVRQLRADKVRVEEKAGESRIYYGEYSLKYAEAKVASAEHAKGDIYIVLNDAIKKDLEFVKTLALGEKYPFFSARPIPKPEEDTGPPEWDLRTAKGVYTLNVGVTYPTPELHNYKQAAVEWVKALRDEGYEAYYYHSPDQARSSICVGTFGDDALVQTPKGSRYSDAVHALRGKADFRYNLENGQPVYRVLRNEKTGEAARAPNESFLVKIPRREGTAPKDGGK